MSVCVKHVYFSAPPDRVYEKLIGKKYFREVCIHRYSDLLAKKETLRDYIKKQEAVRFQTLTGIDSPYEAPINPNIRLTIS